MSNKYNAIIWRVPRKTGLISLILAIVGPNQLISCHSSPYLSNGFAVVVAVAVVVVVVVVVVDDDD